MELHKFSNGRFILLKNNYDVEVFPVQQFGVCLVQIILLMMMMMMMMIIIIIIIIQQYKTFVRYIQLK